MPYIDMIEGPITPEQLREYDNCLTEWHGDIDEPYEGAGICMCADCQEVGPRLRAAAERIENLQADNDRLTARVEQLGDELADKELINAHNNEDIFRYIREVKELRARVAELEEVARPFAVAYRINMQGKEGEFVKMALAVDWFKAAADALGEE